MEAYRFLIKVQVPIFLPFELLCFLTYLEVPDSRLGVSVEQALGTIQYTIYNIVFIVGF